MQTELLNRRRWNTRIELANAIFEYLEIFHNGQRRHSALGMQHPGRIRDALRKHAAGITANHADSTEPEVHQSLHQTRSASAGHRGRRVTRARVLGPSSARACFSSAQ
ncbi:IS3 family transposase [Microbispora maris]|uniref:IS3 family transposase n=1 Tax=Microbispora maris TaxID=3144104 RepID=UPI003D156781